MDMFDWTCLGVIFIHFRSFFSFGQGKALEYFWGPAKFHIFFEVCLIQVYDFWGINSRC